MLSFCVRLNIHADANFLYLYFSPLEGIDEQMTIYDPPPRSGGTPKRRQIHSVIEGATLNNYLNGARTSR